VITFAEEHCDGVIVLENRDQRLETWLARTVKTCSLINLLQHNKACRNILGIRRNGSGLATKAELGRLPHYYT